MTHYNLVQKFIPMTQAMKIPDAKAAVDKEWKKLETMPVWQLDKLKIKRRRLFWKHGTALQIGFVSGSDFAGDLEDSKSSSGGVLCIFGTQTFVSISWMCKKQTYVSHSSTESQVISLDDGLRVDGSTTFNHHQCPTQT